MSNFAFFVLGIAVGFVTGATAYKSSIESEKQSEWDELLKNIRVEN